MTKLHGLLMIAASAIASVGLMALFSPRPAGAQFSSPIRIVRDDEHPARSFVTREAVVSIPAGQNTDSTVLYTVPAGKVLVVEHISGDADAPTGQIYDEIALVGSEPNVGTTRVFASPQRLGTVFGSDRWAISNAVTMYFNPGTVVSFTGARAGGTSGNASAVLNFSGYLMSAP